MKANRAILAGRATAPVEFAQRRRANRDETTRYNHRSEAAWRNGGAKLSCNDTVAAAAMHRVIAERKRRRLRFLLCPPTAATAAARPRGEPAIKRVPVGIGRGGSEAYGPVLLASPDVKGTTMTMRKARWIIFLVGVLLPYVVRLPRGLVWLGQYSEGGLAAWAFLQAFNAVAWGAILGAVIRPLRRALEVRRPVVSDVDVAIDVKGSLGLVPPPGRLLRVLVAGTR